MVTKTTTTVSALFERGERGGFLRFAEVEFRPQDEDPVVSSQMCREFDLRGGETIRGTLQGVGRAAGPGRGGAGGRGRGGGDEDSFGESGGGSAPGSSLRSSLAGVQELVEILEIEGGAAGEHANRPKFHDLTAVVPERQLRLAKDGGPLAMRIVDLFCPIGFGSRGMIVAPPKSGKTILLQQIAHSVASNYPDVHVMILLVDERPEEVTDVKRNVPGEVFASSGDLDAASHVQAAELMISRAQRLVEAGRDVVVLLDSLTRLSRAFNQARREKGRVLTGGLDARALERPKALFGSARALENGGSLTMVATVLTETGSAMDEVIFREFQGAGNMEIVLSNELATQRIWPAIDVKESGTRNEDRLLLEPEIKCIEYLVKKMGRRKLPKATEVLLKELRQYDTNDEMVAALAKNK